MVLQPVIPRGVTSGASATVLPTPLVPKLQSREGAPYRLLWTPSILFRGRRRSSSSPTEADTGQASVRPSSPFSTHAVVATLQPASGGLPVLNGEASRAPQTSGRRLLDIPRQFVSARRRHLAAMESAPSVRPVATRTAAGGYIPSPTPTNDPVPDLVHVRDPGDGIRTVTRFTQERARTMVRVSPAGFAVLAQDRITSDLYDDDVPSVPPPQAPLPLCRNRRLSIRQFRASMRSTGFARCGARLAGLLRWGLLRSRGGQRSVALSSTEAEYVAMGEGIKEASFGVVYEVGYSKHACRLHACVRE